MKYLKVSLLVIFIGVLALGLPALAQDNNVWSFDASGEPQPITDGSAAFGESTLEVVNEVSIHHFDLASGEDTELYRTVAYAVGKIVPQADRLIFSQVPSGEAWLRAIAEGRLDMTDPEAFDQAANLVQVELFSLPLAGGEAAVLGTDLNQVALNPTSVLG